MITAFYRFCISSTLVSAPVIFSLQAFAQEPSAEVTVESGRPSTVQLEPALKPELEPKLELELEPEPEPELELELEPETQSGPASAGPDAAGASPQEIALQQAADAGMPVGNAQRGRIVFGSCRTCHYAEEFMGHNNGPNLHRIFGKVVGQQEGFEYYSQVFKNARFVWTPQLMYAWLENPMAMFPESTMMSLGVADAQARADLIRYLEEVSVRGADADAPDLSQ